MAMPGPSARQFRTSPILPLIPIIPIIPIPIPSLKSQISTVRFKSESLMESPVLPMVLGVY
jgi:hypothetical protein